MSPSRFVHVTLFLSLSTLTLNSAADDDGTWHYMLSGDEATITGCVEICPKDLDIPAVVDGFKISEIGASAFKEKGLTSVVIPDTVTLIREGAFEGNILRELSLPDRLAGLYIGAFKNNYLTSITHPHSVTDIGDHAFENNNL